MYLTKRNPYRMFDVSRELSLLDSVFNNRSGNDDHRFNWSNDEKEYTAEVILPGVKPEDIQVNITNNQLTVESNYENKSSDEKGSRWYASNYSRTVRLPDDVDVDNAVAENNNGILIIHLPKKPEAQPRKLSINVNTAPLPEDKSE